MISWTSRQAWLLLSTVAILVASAAPALSQTLLEDVRGRGVLRVGMSLSVPWAMEDRQGQLTGFEIDVATKVAQDLGVDVEFVPTVWDELIPNLVANKFDVIIAGMSITPQRNLTVNFTRPYAHSGMQMTANIALASELKSHDDFNMPSVIISCRRGTTGCTTAEEVFPKATIQRFDSNTQAFQNVVDGNAHGVVASTPAPLLWVDAHPDQLVLAFDGDNLAEGDEAFALRKGDPDAINYFSNWILVNTSNGWLRKTHNHWFQDLSSWRHLIDLAQ